MSSRSSSIRPSRRPLMLMCFARRLPGSRQLTRSSPPTMICGSVAPSTAQWRSLMGGTRGWGVFANPSRRPGVSRLRSRQTSPPRSCETSRILSKPSREAPGISCFFPGSRGTPRATTRSFVSSRVTILSGSVLLSDDVSRALMGAWMVSSPVGGPSFGRTYAARDVGRTKKGSGTSTYRTSTRARGGQSTSEYFASKNVAGRGCLAPVSATPPCSSFTRG